MPGDERRPEALTTSRYHPRSSLEMTDEHQISDLPKHRRRNSGRSPRRVEPTEVTERQLHRRKHQHHGHHRGHHRERKEVTGEKRKASSTASTTVAARIEEGAGHVFFIDRKGDPQNVVYGGNQTSFTQQYHRMGYGNLIGANRRYRISQDGSKAFDIGPTYDGPRRSHENSLLTFRDNPKLGLEQVKADTIEKNDDGIQLQQEYITVGSKKTKRRKPNVSSEAVNTTMEILSGAQTEGDVHSSGGSESELDIPYENEEDAYEKFRNDAHQRKSVELNRATLEHPQDVDKWLALIAHQDHVFGIDDHTSKEQLSATAMQNLAAIKLALYEKALTRVMDPGSRECLIEGLMDQGAVIWDFDMLSRKWAVLKANPLKSLWIRHVNFRQTTTTFSYEECLSILCNYLTRACSETDLVNPDELSIYLLLRTTTLMLQCGYSERAIAVWQSVLEFTYFRPRHLDASTERSSFQAFWESEIPRIGEPGATGWALSKPFEVPSKSDPDPAPALTSSNDVYEAWAHREGEVAVSTEMPARTLDDVPVDDPFRVILYSDISECLFRPDNITSHVLLINAFLKFCGLPALYYQGSVVTRKWWGDEFLSFSMLSRDQPSSIESTAVSDTRTLFPTEAWLSVFPQTATEDGTDKATWQRTALRQLTAALVNDDALAEYVVAFEASIDIKEARRYAKSLLKGRPSNLRLYNAYALLECRLDRFEIAEHVCSTAMTMCQSTSAVEQQDIARVWSSWIFECLRRGNVCRARVLLSSIPHGQVATDTTEDFSNAASQLRTKNYLVSHLSQQLSLRQKDAVVCFTELLAIFEYLASSQSISAALTVYNTTSETLAKTPAFTSLIEPLHQSRAQLLHIHPKLSPRGYRPAEINRELAVSLRTFPSNSMFHCLYQEHTRRTGLLERIREVIPNGALAYGSNDHDTLVAPLLFAIQAEMSRPSYAGSTNHSIRAAFERAVIATKACVRVWAWYIRWEVSLDNDWMPATDILSSRNKRWIELQRNRAVDVYYRGIRACPWAKELYMLAFLEVPLRKAIGDTELRRIYELMLEKGLRLHSEWNEGE